MLRVFGKSAPAGWAVAAGLVLALLTPTRPAHVVWLPLGILVLMVCGAAPRWRCVAGFALGALLPLGAWTARNVIHTGRPVVLTTIGAGMNLWVGTRNAGRDVMQPVAESGQTRWTPTISFGDTEAERRRAQVAWNDYMGGLLQGGDADKVERADAALRQLAMESGRAQPGRAVGFRVRNALRNFAFGEGRGMPWRILLGLPFWIAALMGAIRAWKQRDGALLFLCGAPWVRGPPTCRAALEVRYLFPCWPLLLAASAAAWSGDFG